MLVPAFNEAATIGAVLDRVAAVDFTRLGLAAEIIVISDGSTDATALLARARTGVRVVELATNRGKGAAIRAGLAQARGEVVLVQDADLEYDPADYAALLAPLLRGSPVVYGSRVLGFERDFGRSFWRKHPDAYAAAYLGGRIVSLVTNLLYGTSLTDAPTGYKCFRAQALREVAIEADSFDWEPEVTAKLARRGVSIVEVPISYRPRSFSAGKKLMWKHGFSALWALFKHRGWS